MQKLQSFPAPKPPQSNSDMPNFRASQIGAAMNPVSPNWNHDMSHRRHGIPPSHPNNSGSRSNSQNSGSQNVKQGPGHSRSLSQPMFFNFNPDCLPPLSPSPIDVSKEDKVVNSNGNGKPIPNGNETRASEPSLPPRSRHRRSNSDIPSGFSAMIQSSPPLVPVSTRGAADRSHSGGNGNSNVDGSGERKSEGEVGDDLFSTYMNLDNFDALKSSNTEEKDPSGAKTGDENSDNEVESSGDGYPVGAKRRALGDIARSSRHHRSVSMDSYIGSLQFDENSMKNHGGQVSPGELMDVNWSKSKLLLGDDGFTPAEMKKIMENPRLAELLSVDPKRVKRILANRQSAARSKERKHFYISELEHKVQTLQTEATTLSAQVTMLQRDSAGLKTQNNELKFRLHAMEKQARLKDALNEALAMELQRLKHTVGEFSGEAQLSSRLLQQLSLNNQMFQFQPQQSNAYQVLQQQRKAPQPAQNNQEQKNEAPANKSSKA